MSTGRKTIYHSLIDSESFGPPKELSLRNRKYLTRPHYIFSVVQRQNNNILNDNIYNFSPKNALKILRNFQESTLGVVPFH